jgi:hypothetical protein
VKLKNAGYMQDAILLKIFKMKEQRYYIRDLKKGRDDFKGFEKYLEQFNKCEKATR